MVMMVSRALTDRHHTSMRDFADFVFELNGRVVDLEALM